MLRNEVRSFPPLIGFGFPGIFEENVSSIARD